MNSTSTMLPLRFLLGFIGAWGLLLIVAPVPSSAQTAIDRARQIDRVDQNLGQVNPTTKPLDWITGLEVRPEGITEVDEPAPQKKRKKR